MQIYSSPWLPGFLISLYLFLSVFSNIYLSAVLEKLGFIIYLKSYLTLHVVVMLYGTAVQVYVIDPDYIIAFQLNL